MVVAPTYRSAVFAGIGQKRKSSADRRARNRASQTGGIRCAQRLPMRIIAEVPKFAAIKRME